MRRSTSRIAAASAAIVLATGLAAGCSSDADTASPGAQSQSAAAATPVPGEVALVDPSVFAATINATDAVVIDVRTPAEFAEGHIEGAVNIDVEDPAAFTAAVANLDPAATYAVYCRSGNRSATATAYLVDEGFASVAELDGGIVAWTDAGLPVTS
jgi:rhodanese-related sulfurtransferase